MKRIFSSTLSALFLLLAVFAVSVTTPSSPSHAQSFIEALGGQNQITPEQLQSHVTDHFSTRDSGKGTGHKQIKRVIENLRSRGSMTGAPIKNYSALAANAVDTISKSLSATGKQIDWQFQGPSTYVAGDVSQLSKLTLTPGLGRLNAIAVDPNDRQTIYVGSASGGIWRTTNGGSSWTPLTDMAPAMAYSDMVVDHSDPNTIYALSGDGDGRILPSIGVLKSTDGGTTWSVTALEFAPDTLVYGYRLAMDQANPSHLIVATTMGLFRTLDGGGTWDLVEQGGFFDVQFSPAGDGVVYAATSATVMRSTDNGATFELVTRGLPAKGTAGIYRVGLAVSPASPDSVYALFGGDKGFVGLFHSSDSGKGFDLRSVAPNILDASPNGSQSVSQAWYDMAIAADPTDGDTVNVGGINTWRSTDGGRTWTLTSFWQYANDTAPYVHPDVHRIIYDGDRMYVGNDGGIYFSPDRGDTWKDLSQGLGITEIFRVCAGPGTDGKLYFGAQDNGSDLLEEGTAIQVWGGDGTNCQVAPNDEKRVLISQQFGDIFRSLNGAYSFDKVWVGAPGKAPSGVSYIVPYQLHPQLPQYVYSCYFNVYLGLDSATGIAWQPLTALGAIGNDACIDMQVAPSDARYVYVAKSSNVYRSEGPRWYKLPAPWLGKTTTSRVAVDPKDPQHAWLVLSGYTDGEKIYEGRGQNGGQMTWQNISGSLPNISFYSILPEGGDKNGVYIGSDVGVFYRNDDSTDWEFVSGPLPRVVVRDLIVRPETSRIVAATYGRGIWEGELIDPPK